MACGITTITGGITVSGITFCYKGVGNTIFCQTIVCSGGACGTAAGDAIGESVAKSSFLGIIERLLSWANRG